MKRYWVIGGEYSSTAFKETVDGTPPRRYGPFATEEEAKARWAALSWAEVDNCHARYAIEVEDVPAGGPTSSRAA
jgi:hypothetical protein